MASKTSPHVRLNVSAVFLVLCVHLRPTHAVAIQPGIFELDFINFISTSLRDYPTSGEPKLIPGKYYLAVMKNTFSDTPVDISIIHEEARVSDDVRYSVGWEIRYTTCEGLYENTDELGNPNIINVLYNRHDYLFPVEDYILVQGKEDDRSKIRTVHDSRNFPRLRYDSYGTCYSESAYRTSCLQGVYLSDYDISKFEDDVDEFKDDGDEFKDDGDEFKDDGDERKGYGYDSEMSSHYKFEVYGRKERSYDSENYPGYVVTTQRDGSHLVILQLHIHRGSMTSFKVQIEMKGDYGYLSASQYPLLKFYCVMCGFYFLLGFTCSLLFYFQCKGLLGIHIWIGACIFISFVEKTAFFAEFMHVNNNGKESQAGVLFPELLSCLNRTMARLLVLVISLGYCITRSSLGDYLRYIIAAGLLYLVLFFAEALFGNSDEFGQIAASLIPVCVLDLAFICWICWNLIITDRILHHKKNKAQIRRYYFFKCTLLLCVLLSLVFFLWSLKTHIHSDCIKNWHLQWLDVAFWDILYCIMLMVVVILFPPFTNRKHHEKQDESNKELMLSEFYDGMTHRSQEDVS